MPRPKAPKGGGWWRTKARQFRTHLRASVDQAELRELYAWLTPAQATLFESMHVADRRHGLNVVARLRAEGIEDADLLLAGLLHDAGKGDTGLWPRVAWSLGEHYGAWIWRAVRLLPGFRAAMARLATHADRSASLAATAGCSDRTVALIRQQSSPGDDRWGELLKLADEAN
jgi:hypothetical protein